MLGLLKHVLIILITTYVFVLVYSFINQKNFIFMPTRDIGAIPEFLQAEEVSFLTSDGEKLHAWWMNLNPEAKTVLFFHGNAGNLTHRINQMKIFADLGLNALMVDYRGYGKSSGTIRKEHDVYVDAKAAFEFLKNEKNIQEENIILWGRSLGGSVVIHLAQETKIAAAVVESTMFSGVDVAKKYYWYLPVQYLLKYKFESGKKIGNINSPILIMHGPNDEIMPFEQGEKLFQAANEPKQFFKLKGGHNTGLYESYDEYIVEVRNFLNKL